MTSEPTNHAPPEAESPDTRQRSARVQQQLDEALAASFPASDPVSIVTSQTEEDWGEQPGEDAAPAPAPR